MEGVLSKRTSYACGSRCAGKASSSSNAPGPCTSRRRRWRRRARVCSTRSSIPAARPRGGAMTRILVQMRDSLVRRIAEALPDADVVPIPAEGDLAPGVGGEVLLTMAWGSPNLAQVLARGVRWVHALGTGVDRFP